MSDLLELSGRLGSMTNLVHGFIYFAPEASEEFDALGPVSYTHLTLPTKA